jgi:hypothetical protein
MDINLRDLERRHPESPGGVAKVLRDPPCEGARSRGILLTAKELKTGEVGTIGAICPKKATNFFKHYKPSGPWAGLGGTAQISCRRTVFNRCPQVAPRLRGAHAQAVISVAREESGTKGSVNAAKYDFREPPARWGETNQKSKGRYTHFTYMTTNYPCS